MEVVLWVDLPTVQIRLGCPLSHKVLIHWYCLLTFHPKLAQWLSAEEGGWEGRNTAPLRRRLRMNQVKQNVSNAPPLPIRPPPPPTPCKHIQREKAQFIVKAWVETDLVETECNAFKHIVSVLNLVSGYVELLSPEESTWKNPAVGSCGCRN